jgi:serine/threonine protein phosphatase 1
MKVAIGDVHGCLTELKELLEDELKISKDDQVYFVGDLITKGPNSLGVLEYLMGLQADGYQIASVLGNHEYRILHLYHNDFPLLEEYLDEYEAMDILSGEVDKIMAFLESFPFYIETDGFIIVHTSLGLEDHYNQHDARSMFGPDKFAPLYENSVLEKAIQVYGHRVRSLDDIVTDSFLVSGSIGIDGGCVYPSYGFLCALDLETVTVSHIDRFP